MKTLLFSMLISLNILPLQSQTDSLLTVLKQTVPNRSNLQDYLDKMEALPPVEIEQIRTIGDWIIRNTQNDSLLEMQAMANLSLGKSYTHISRYADATKYLTNAQIISEKNNFHSIHAQALNALGVIYKSNEQYEKAIGYFEKSLTISINDQYQLGKARALYNLGSTYLNSKPGTHANIRSSADLMLQGLKIVLKLHDTQSIVTQSRGVAGAYGLMKDYDSALIFLDMAETLMKKDGKELALVTHYRQKAKIYNDLKNYPEAMKYYESGLQLARKYNVPRWMCMYYAGMAETYENTGNYKKANEYNRLNVKMHDALVSKENFAAAADIQNRYERSQKDNELLRLSAVNKRRSTLNSFLIAASVGLLLIAFLGYKNFISNTRILTQQKEIQQQKISELEKDKQLVAIDAMLKGQEEERSRIAKDLHDGLGGLLSGTRLSFVNFRENLSLSPQNIMLFNKSLSMLDNTIGDLRKVAQNLMPEALVKFGLSEALSDFCDMIQASSGIKMICNHYGERLKLPATAEMSVYRIIQELVNNAVKHADAKQIIVQLTMSQNKIGITVEDNGKGFDTGMLNQIKGAGLANINHRVQYYNGITDIVSSVGNGTSINIQLYV